MIRFLKKLFSSYDIYLIHPVGAATQQEEELALAYVREQEARGKRVYYPKRDADQATSGMRICVCHRGAMVKSREVHVIYVERLQGIHFDMGVAFALGKPVVLVSPGGQGSGPGSLRHLTPRYSSP